MATFGFIGTGNMGGALARAARKRLSGGEILLANRSAAKAEALAQELDLPVIFHDREAHADCLAMVKEFPGVRGVFHCFSGSPEMAEELLKRGWYLGFDGPVTYKNARRAPEVMAVTPLDRIVVETDAPYMSPVPNRGRRNDSRNLPYIVEKLAEWKGISPEEMAAHTWNNGLRLFGLEGKV